MAETNINFTPAQDVEKIYDDLLITELNYDKVKNIINNDIKLRQKAAIKPQLFMKIISTIKLAQKHKLENLK